MEQQKVMLAIKGDIEGEAAGDEAIELKTEGVYFREDHADCLSYQESDVFGMEGTTTTIKIENGKVTLVRLGTINSMMEFETGKRNITLYATPYGEISLGLLTQSIDTDYEDGLPRRVAIAYTVEVGGMTNSHNAIDIRVSPAEED